MREHLSREKKTTTGFSIPSLKHPIRGFGLESSAISPQAVPKVQPLHKAVTHDISRISLRSQGKLSISQPGDIYEQEADSVAQQVMQRMAQPVNRQSIQREALSEEEELQMKPLANSITPLVQRQQAPEVQEELQMKSLDNSTLQRQEVPEDEEELQMKPMVQRQAESGTDAAPDLEASINQARGGGQPMADNIREPMEQAFGADFSGVKVHTDGQSDQLNRSIQARAFTTGQDVFFGQGEYNPGSRGGQELIAHELTHVVQQNGKGNAMQSQSFCPSQIQRNGDGSDKEPSEGSLRPALGKALWSNLYGSNWYAKGIFKAMNLAMYVEGQSLTTEHNKVLQDCLIKNEKGVLDTLIAENPLVMKSTGKTPIYLLGKYAVHWPLEQYLKNKKE